MLVTNYLFKNLLKTALFITVVITMVVLLTQSLKILELVANTAAPATLFSKMFLLTLPKLFETVLPVSLAITVLFVYNRMIMDNEVVVMRACGCSQKQLAMPAVILGVGASIVLMIFSLWFTPASVNEVKSLKFDARTKYAAFMLKEGVFNTFSDDFTVYIRKKGSSGDMLGIMIHDNRDKDKPPVTITAKKGLVVTDGEYPVILVYNGMRQQLDKENGALTKLYFEKYSVEVKGLSGDIKKRWRKEDERGFLELFNPNLDDERDIANSKLFIVEAYRRMITPWNALAFVSVAVISILVGSFNRKGQTSKIVIGTLSVILIQILTIVFTNLSKKYIWALPLLYANTIVPVVMSMWFLNPYGEKFLNGLFLELNKLLNIKYARGAK